MLTYTATTLSKQSQFTRTMCVLKTHAHDITIFTDQRCCGLAYIEMIKVSKISIFRTPKHHYRVNEWPVFSWKRHQCQFHLLIFWIGLLFGIRLYECCKFKISLNFFTTKDMNYKYKNVINLIAKYKQPKYIIKIGLKISMGTC